MRTYTFGLHFMTALSALVLACGGGGGKTEGGDTDTTTTDTTQGSTGTTSTTTTSGPATDGSGSGGQTEGATDPGTSTSTGTTSTSTSTGTDTTAMTGGSSTGGGLCDDFVQPGCIHTGCPEGQSCDTNVGCVPSSCGCDPVTGDVICTADCGGGTCVDPGECEPIMCELECKFGFKKDENGCEICECAEAPDCGCESDADCVKASPGCCSCSMGGTEVAVAMACIDQLEKCPLPPDEVFCPAVFLCTDAQAVCQGGACVLQ